MGVGVVRQTSGPVVKKMGEKMDKGHVFPPSQANVHKKKRVSSVIAIISYGY
jgi:hypothetical protein